MHYLFYLIGITISFVGVNGAPIDIYGKNISSGSPYYSICKSSEAFNSKYSCDSNILSPNHRVSCSRNNSNEINGIQYERINYTANHKDSESRDLVISYYPDANSQGEIENETLIPGQHSYYRFPSVYVSSRLSDTDMTFCAWGSLHMSVAEKLNAKRLESSSLRLGNTIAIDSSEDDNSNRFINFFCGNNKELIEYLNGYFQNVQNVANSLDFSKTLVDNVLCKHGLGLVRSEDIPQLMGQKRFLNSKGSPVNIEYPLLISYLKSVYKNLRNVPSIVYTISNPARSSARDYVNVICHNGQDSESMPCFMHKHLPLDIFNNIKSSSNINNKPTTMGIEPVTELPEDDECGDCDCEAMFD